MMGMEDARVQELQERLMELGFLDIDETTQYYGPATNYAVQLFQRQHDLDMDGICGPQTLSVLYSDDAKHYTLLQGTEGNDVDMLQSRLVELGYLSISTGYYGTETIDAVKAFQERNDIGVDGKTGQVTLDIIYSADAKPSPEMEQQERRRGNINNFLDSLRAQMGKPYVWGASGPSSFDCSGLVTYCLRQAGSTTGRLNAQGFSENSRWEKISSMDNMEIGDLIFYSGNGRRVGHVGVYIGDGRMIDASSANGEVVERSCRTSYWESHFVCARRPW
jgi:cell wall-associated NlpC family hydrolase